MGLRVIFPGPIFPLDPLSSLCKTLASRTCVRTRPGGASRNANMMARAHTNAHRHAKTHVRRRARAHTHTHTSAPAPSSAFTPFYRESRTRARTRARTQSTHSDSAVDRSFMFTQAYQPASILRNTEIKAHRIASRCVVISISYLLPFLSPPSPSPALTVCPPQSPPL